MKLFLSYHHLYRVFLKFIPWSKSVEIESNLDYWKIWDFVVNFLSFFFFVEFFFGGGGSCSWKIYWSICCRVLFFFQFWCWNVDIDPHPVHLLAIIIYTLIINHFPYLPNQHLCMVHQFISICTDIFIHEMISFSSSDGAFLM